MTADSVTCSQCRDHLNEPYVTLDDAAIAGLNGCVVRVKQTEDDSIVQAERLCRGPLHQTLQFEPHPFSGQLPQQVHDVCNECWETYVDNQWTEADTGGELAIVVRGDQPRAEYYASSIEAVQDYHESGVRLRSKNGLTTEFPKEEIESISLRPTRQIDY